MSTTAANRARGHVDEGAGAESVTVGCNPLHRAHQVPDTPWGRPRRSRGWSIREVAERTGINRGEISRIERGRACPTPDQARRLLAAYEEDR